VADAPEQLIELAVETATQALPLVESAANQTTKILNLAEALRAENLRKSYRSRCVVNNVSIVVSPGEIVGLLGPNGAGKTTTFYMVLGLERPDAGRILLGELDITRLPIHKRARSGISYYRKKHRSFAN
jgi:ABC-type lipopolysaccharide export system ATPase subunit